MDILSRLAVLALPLTGVVVLWCRCAVNRADLILLQTVSELGKMRPLTLDDLAAHSRYSVRQVSRIVARLLDCRAIERIGAGGRGAFVYLVDTVRVEELICND